MAGKITGLVVQKKNKERVNVYIDDEFAFGLAMIEAIKLRKGQELSAEEIARLKALDEVEVAHEKALNFLSYRPRSADEVRRSLRDKGYADPVIEQVMERLERVGLVNDDDFARYWVDNRDQFKPKSGRGLRYELRQKGITDDAIEAALEGVDEESSAYRAASQRAKRLPRDSKQVFAKRLGEYLARRGFPYDVVREVTERLWSELTEGDEPAHDESDNDFYTED
jgi:regulatory protein